MSPPDGVPGHDVACVAHVHSTWSDGTATVPEIAGAAARAGAQAVLLTDHDTLAARDHDEGRWHDGVLVVVGHEVSPSGGHLLVFGSDEVIPHVGRTEEEIAADAARAGGVAFAAHPFSEGSRMSTRIGRPHGWRALEATDTVGVELWSLTTDVAESWRSPREALRFLRRPEAGLDGPPARHLRRWDELGRRRRVPAIGGLDAHQPGLRLRLRGRPLAIQPHARYFRMLQTHALLPAPLTGDAASDGAEILGALAAGSAFLAVEAFAPAAGFGFWAERDGEAAGMGREVRGDGWWLRARLPRRARTTVLRDGEPVAETVGDRIEHRIDGPGVHRLEARVEAFGRERVWLLSNPVYVRNAPG